MATFYLPSSEEPIYDASQGWYHRAEEPAHWEARRIATEPLREFEAQIRKGFDDERGYKNYITYHITRSYHLCGTIGLPLQPTVKAAKEALDKVSAIAWPLLTHARFPAIAELPDAPPQIAFSTTPPNTQEVSPSIFDKEYVLASSAFEQHRIKVTGYLNHEVRTDPWEGRWVTGFTCKQDGYSIGTFLHQFQTKQKAFTWANIMAYTFAKMCQRIFPQPALAE